MPFQHGQLKYSVGIHRRVAQQNDLVFATFVNSCVFRHINGNFGDLDEFDIEANRIAVETGGERIMSSYISQELAVKIWIITSVDRTETLITTPEEYQSKGNL